MSVTRIRVQTGSEMLSYELERFGKDTVIMGRNSDSDIVIPDPGVSEHHGCFYRQNGVWYYQDMNSTNGTSVNGQAINYVQLQNGLRLVLDRNGRMQAPVIDVAYYNPVVAPTPPQQQQSGTQYSRGQSAQPMGANNGSQPGMGGMPGAQPSMYRANAAQQYPYQQQRSVPASQQPAKKKSMAPLIAIISSVAAVLLVVVLLFAFGVFGGKEEGGSEVAKASTEAFSTQITEKPTEATEKPTEPVTEKPTETAEPTEAPTEEPGRKELQPEEIYELANQSTVEVQAVNNAFGSVGTGFFDDENGTVITNYHVIDGMLSAEVLTSDGEKHEVTGVLGYDTDMDIAILATDVKNSVPLTRRTGKVTTGEKVYALGSSQGYEGTFTEGIVSTAERKEMGHVYIQHSAPITNGNSGGPLLDKYGQVVGINNWMRTDGQNLNFAIPIEQIDQVSRNKTMSLEDVFRAENDQPYQQGTTETNQTEGGSWFTFGSYNGKTLKMKAPKGSETESDNNAGQISRYEENAGIFVYGSVIQGDPQASVENNAEEIKEGLLEELNELSTEYQFEYGEVEMETMLINDNRWTTFSTIGTFTEAGENSVIEVTILVCQKDDAVAHMEILLLVDEDDEDTAYNMLTIYTDMLATLTFK